MLDKDVGYRIRKQRELLGLTRESFSEKVDITPKFCSDIESGNKGMSVDTLIRMSKELLVTTDYILFGSNSKVVDEEIINLVNACPEDKIIYLKSIMRDFIKSCK